MKEIVGILDVTETEEYVSEAKKIIQDIPTLEIDEKSAIEFPDLDM